MLQIVTTATNFYKKIRRYSCSVLYPIITLLLNKSKHVTLHNK